MRSSRCDDELADSVVGDGEVPLQLGGAAGEVAREPARDYEPGCGERVGAEDIGRVRVSRRWADLHGQSAGLRPRVRTTGGSRPGPLSALRFLGGCSSEPPGG